MTLVSQERTGAARRGRPPATDRARNEQRLHISRHAVRLFRDRGVAATSGQQIAHAAEVSERTLWRLFRTKESCVEPLLSQAVDSFHTVIRACPPGRTLDEHLRAQYRFLPASAGSDLDAVLAIIRMSREEPGLRAVWLLLQERSEPALAEVLGRQTGRPADALEIRVRAAGLNAALRVAAEDFAWSAAGNGPAGDVDGQRIRLAEAFRSAAPSRADRADGPGTFIG